MKKKIYIRADGSAQIGLGHLVRCMALAQMLEVDFGIYFVCMEIPERTGKEIRDLEFSLIKINTESDFFDLLTGNEIVVLDHYGLDTAYQKNIKKIGSKLVCIDDMCDKEFYADLIINHTPGITPRDYNAQAYTRFALGAAFTLLRPEFLATAKQVGAVPLSDSVLICFGGSDSRNLTLQTLKIILENNKIAQINVITGTTYQHLHELKEIESHSNNITLFHAIGANKVVELMTQSSLIIVPSSGVLLEALAVGNTVISGMYADNQRYLFEKYHAANVFISAGGFSSGELKSALAQSVKQSEKKIPIIDGLSGERILKVFRQIQLEEKIHFRKAIASDLDLTYKWATDSNIRAFSFNQSEIKWEEHSEWFLSKIKDPDCYYYIAEWNEQLIGSIRFDIKREEAIISYLIDVGYHHKGLGIVLLKKGIVEVIKEGDSKIKKIIGFVMPQNAASCKAFEQLYFSKENEETSYKYTLIKI